VYILQRMHAVVPIDIRKDGGATLPPPRGTGEALALGQEFTLRPRPQIPARVEQEREVVAGEVVHGVGDGDLFAEEAGGGPAAAGAGEVADELAARIDAEDVVVAGGHGGELAAEVGPAGLVEQPDAVAERAQE